MKRKEELFQLIHSLDKHEKRFFKLFASIEEGDHSYMKIFDFIDKQKEYNEDEVREQTGIPKNVFAVQKHFLFNLILNRIAMLHSSKESDLRMLLNQADILHKKGLYSSYEKLMRKAKERAKHFDLHGFTLEILRMEHVNAWRKTDLKEAKNIIHEEKQILRLFNNQKEYTHLANEIITLLSLSGEGGDEKHEQRLNQLIRHPLMLNEKNALTFNSTYTLYHTQFTYYYIHGNLNKQYVYAKKAVGLYDSRPEKIKHTPQQYLFSVHNFVTSCNQLNKYEEAKIYIDKLHEYFNLLTSEREKAWAFFTYHVNHLDYFINTAKFDEGIIIAEELIEELRTLKLKLDKMHGFLLHFDAAKIFFSAGEIKKSLSCMNRVKGENEVQQIRTDLYAAVQVFYLMVHYEKGNIELLEHLVKSEQRASSDSHTSYKFTSVMFEFFGKKIPKIESKNELKEEFIILRKQLLILKKDKHEKTPMEQFDYISWVESRIENKSFAEIVKTKSLE